MIGYEIKTAALIRIVKKNKRQFSPFIRRQRGHVCIIGASIFPGSSPVRDNPEIHLCVCVYDAVPKAAALM